MGQAAEIELDLPQRNYSCRGWRHSPASSKYKISSFLGKRTALRWAELLRGLKIPNAWGSPPPQLQFKRKVE